MARSQWCAHPHDQHQNNGPRNLGAPLPRAPHNIHPKPWHRGGGQVQVPYVHILALYYYAFPSVTGRYILFLVAN